MKHKRSIICCLPLLIPLLLLMACRPACSTNTIMPDYTISARQEVNYFQSEACEPPCWNGIVPGSTTGDEAEAILNDLTFVRPESVHKEPNHGFPNSEVIVWHTALSDWPYQIGQIILQDNIVRRTVVKFEYAVTVENLMAEFGEPTTFRLISQTPRCHTVLLYWFDQGVGALLNSGRGNLTKQLITTDTTAEDIRFYSPVESAAEYLMNAVLAYEDDAIISASDSFADWQGIEQVRFSVVYPDE